MIMKKYFSLFAAVAVAATSFISCSKDNSPLVEEREIQKVKISFNATSSDPDTKTYFGAKTDNAYPTIWSENQKVKAIFNLNANWSYDATVVPAGDGKTASFDAEFTGLPNDDTQLWLQAVSPATSYCGNNGGWGLGFNVPSTQTPTMTSVDEAAHILYAGLDDALVANAMPEKITLRFAHIAAYGKFMLKNFPEDVTIKSIELSSTEYLTGNSMYPANEYYTGGFDQKKTLTINPSKLSAESNSAKVFWFSFLPVNLEGKTLTVKILTDAGVYTKAIAFPSGKGNFKAGKVASFNINMSGIAPEPLKYVLVTDYSELTEGSEVMIVASNFNYAISVNKTTYETHRQIAAVTKNSNYIQNPDDDVQLFTLSKGVADNTVKFECKNGGFAGKYIGALTTASPSDYNQANQWKYIYNMDAATSEITLSFIINLQSNADALISQYNSQNAYKYIGFNYNSYDITGSLFRIENGYTTNDAVSIYKLEGSGDGGEQLIIPEPEIRFTSGVNVPAGYEGMDYVGNTMYLPAAGGTYTVDVEVLYPQEGGFLQDAININGGGYNPIPGLARSWNASKTQLTVTLPQNTGSARSAYMVVEYSYHNGTSWVDVQKWLYIAQAGVVIK